MGRKSLSGIKGLTAINGAPESDETDFDLIGPGYGECALVHIGNQRWVIVDSRKDADRKAAALSYLNDLSVDPAESVCLIVATHGHDDHIAIIRYDAPRLPPGRYARDTQQ